MTTAELARQVKNIEISTKKAVTATFAGEYKSAFKGRGMEFDEVREYQIGDDIRSIDWNVTARLGKPHTKRYMEERELTVILLVDLSGSGEFGSGRASKQHVAAYISSLLAFSAIKNNDRVGLLVFTDHVERFVPPRKGTSHVLRLVRDLLAFRPRNRGTDIGGALGTLSHLLKRRAVVFLVSDFLDSGYSRAIRVAARRHDLIAVSITDPHEYELPAVGLIDLIDAEDGRPSRVDTDSRAVREAHQREQQERADSLNELFAANGIDHVPVTVGEDYVRPLVRLFVNRERRM